MPLLAEISIPQDPVPRPPAHNWAIEEGSRPASSRECAPPLHRVSPHQKPPAIAPLARQLFPARRRLVRACSHPLSARRRHHHWRRWDPKPTRPRGATHRRSAEAPPPDRRIAASHLAPSIVVADPDHVAPVARPEPRRRPSTTRRTTSPSPSLVPILLLAGRLVLASSPARFTAPRRPIPCNAREVPLPSPLLIHRCAHRPVATRAAPAASPRFGPASVVATQHPASAPRDFAHVFANARPRSPSSPRSGYTPRTTATRLLALLLAAAPLTSSVPERRTTCARCGRVRPPQLHAPPGHLCPAPPPTPVPSPPAGERAPRLAVPSPPLAVPETADGRLDPKPTRPRGATHRRSAEAPPPDRRIAASHLAPSIVAADPDPVALVARPEPRRRPSTTRRTASPSPSLIPSLLLAGRLVLASSPARFIAPRRPIPCNAREVPLPSPLLIRRRTHHPVAARAAPAASPRFGLASVVATPHPASAPRDFAHVFAIARPRSPSSPHSGYTPCMTARRLLALLLAAAPLTSSVPERRTTCARCGRVRPPQLHAPPGHLCPAPPPTPAPSPPAGERAPRLAVPSPRWPCLRQRTGACCARCGCKRTSAAPVAR
nr:proline-rich protein 36-like [Aegilops tauschii subsp. strangulata]